MCIRDRSNSIQVRFIYLPAAAVRRRSLPKILDPAKRSYPVSYTHLDVYKRQVKMWSVKSGDTPGVFHSLSHPHKRKGAGRNRGGYTVTALRFPALLGRQSRRGLEIGSLSRPLAALRRFPQFFCRRQKKNF